MNAADWTDFSGHDLGDGVRDEDFGLGLGLDLVDRHAGGHFGQHEAMLVVVHFEDAQVGDDHVDATLAGQREGALLDDLGLALLVGVLHGDDDLADAGDQVHRAAHALDHLAGDHPVGDIALLADFHGAQDAHVDVPASDHAEALGATEEAGAGAGGHRLLAGIDQVGVDLGLGGEGADAQQPVLGLQPYVHALGDVVGHEGRHADAKVHDVAVAQFLGRPPGDLVSGKHGQVYPQRPAQRPAASRLARMRFSRLFIVSKAPTLYKDRTCADKIRAIAWFVCSILGMSSLSSSACEFRKIDKSMTVNDREDWGYEF
eukprot:TRINITY_DN4164_c1_g1_i6.p1 TRINITY_DN4164_c1_g1~~TRINITY_DN4164_c1_g1_i6.p1  ORF type:complete len:316 (+),score=45.89 TRINITY_DN4164_c1_g1_i6:256-1203(+)